jgi:hypothetical protein
MRLVISVLVLVLASAPGALAQQVAPLTSSSAVRQANGQVALSLTYDGSACEKTGEAEVFADGIVYDEVVIPTTRTAETCTLQITPVTYAGTIAVEPRTEGLEVMVLDPDGGLKAAGQVAVTSGSAVATQ